MKHTTLILLALLCLLLLPDKASSQLIKRTFGTNGDETNSFILNFGGSEHFIISHVSTGMGDIMVTKYNSITGGVLSRRTYGEANVEERTVSCMIDNSNQLVLLVNNLTGDWIDIFVINPSTGTVTMKEYKLGLNDDLRGVRVVCGQNGNYYFVANLVLPGQESLDDAYFFEIKSTDLSIQHQAHFSIDNPLGFYDLAEMKEGNKWVISGAKLTGVNFYQSFVFIYNPVTGLKGVEKLYDITGNNDAFDRVTVDVSHRKIYLGYHAHYGPYTQMDVGVVCVDYDFLNIQWTLELQTEGNGENERLSSMIYNSSTQMLYLSGFSQVGNQHGFITCINTTTQSWVWSKYPANMAAPNPSAPFRIDLQNNQILYTSDFPKGANRDILWGAEIYGPAVASCFETINYQTRNVYPSGTIDLDYDIPSFTLAIRPIAPETTSWGEFVGCACPAPPGYVVLTNATLTQDAFWGTQAEGIKYFIEGTLTVNSNIVLDATNVDVMFSEDAKILLKPDATLRANNSVFRPCNPGRTWGGIFFEKNPKGVVNNCVFKNANFALDLRGLSNNLKITNNQFSNCLVSIHWRTPTNINGSITGNKFFVDNSYLVFPLGNPAYSLSQYYTGIIVIDATSTAEMIVSQNEFVFANGASQLKRDYGIYASNSRFKTTENTFTNCYRAIDVDRALDMAIDNNEFEITRENFTHDYQIRVTANSLFSGIRIANNRFNNFNAPQDLMYTPTAIYLDFINTFYVHENLINGFQTGVQTRKSSNGRIYSNKILNATLLGVYAEDCFRLSIRCNEIDMRMNATQTPGSVGIYYRQTDPNPENLDIRGNCIFNSYVAMNFVSALNNVPVPKVRNNYMYNYTYAGIYNEKFTGSIGTGTGATLAGRNSFISHNKSVGFGAFDMYSTTPGLSENGNYNMTIFNMNVTVGALNQSYSTASCGQFFASIPTPPRTELEDKCNFPYFTNGTVKNWTWDPPPGGGGGPGEGQMRGQERLDFWARMASAIDKAELPGFVGMVVQKEKDVAVKTLFQAYLQIQAKNYSEANALLAQVPTSDAALSKTKERLSWTSRLMAANQVPDDASKKIIAGLVNENDFFVPALRVFLEPGDEGFEYVFAAPVKLNIGDATGAIKLYADVMKLSVYPNPGTGEEVRIEFAAPEEKALVLNIRDVTGRLVLVQGTKASAGITHVSIRELPNGLYFISLEADGKVLKTEKLMVAH